MPRTPNPPSVAYTRIDPIPHRDLYRQGSRGPDVPRDWPARYLHHLATHGTQWLAAKQAGISKKTVERLRLVDARFVEDEQDAVREHAEHLEQNLNRIADGSDMPAVTANIVRLKKIDPTGYVEKNLSISATFSAELDATQGQELLRAMLQNLTPESRQAVAGVLPGSSDQAQTRALESGQ